MAHRLQFSDTDSSGRSSFELNPLNRHCPEISVTVRLGPGRQKTKNLAVTGLENLDAVFLKLTSFCREMLLPKAGSVFASSTPSLGTGGGGPLFSPAGLVEVSEDEDDQIFTSSSYGESYNKNSLDIRECCSTEEKAAPDVLQCTPSIEEPVTPDIFKGTSFVLSITTPLLTLPPPLTQPPHPTTNSTPPPGTSFVLSITTPEDEMEDEDSQPTTDKIHLESTIRAGGGLVYDTIPPGELDNVMLLSNRASPSRKYIEALIRGIPCVSVTMIEDAIKHGWTPDQCRVSNLTNGNIYLLPRGTYCSAPHSQSYDVDLLLKKELIDLKAIPLPGHSNRSLEPPKKFTAGTAMEKSVISGFILNRGGSHGILWYTLVYSTTFSAIFHIPKYTKVYQNIPKYTKIYQFTYACLVQLSLIEKIYLICHSTRLSPTIWLLKLLKRYDSIPSTPPATFPTRNGKLQPLMPGKQEIGISVTLCVSAHLPLESE
eukprot:sb/3464221/